MNRLKNFTVVVLMLFLGIHGAANALTSETIDPEAPDDWPCPKCDVGKYPGWITTEVCGCSACPGNGTSNGYDPEGINFGNHNDLSTVDKLIEICFLPKGQTFTDTSGSGIYPDECFYSTTATGTYPGGGISPGNPTRPGKGDESGEVEEGEEEAGGIGSGSIGSGSTTLP